MYKSATVAPMSRGFATPRPASVVARIVCIVAGGLAAVQGVLIAELSTRLGGGFAGAALTNALGGITGLMVLAVALAASPRQRRSFRFLVSRSHERRLTGWEWFATLGGLAAGIVTAWLVPLIGIGLFTVAFVGGQTIAGLAIDRIGLGPKGRIATTHLRVLGAAVCLLGVGLTLQWDKGISASTAFVVFAFAAGVAAAFQQAGNGRFVALTRTLTPVLLVNFAVGACVSCVLAVVVGSWPSDASDWPTDPFLYAGPLISLTVIAVAAVAVRFLGVLVTAMLMIGGQITTSILLDTVHSSGVGAQLLAGAAVLLIGLGLTLYASAMSTDPEEDQP